MIKDHSRHDIRQQLIEAAYEVFLSQGYSQSSIRKVAAQANITPGLVSYYFKSKNDLLYAVHDYVQKQYHSNYIHSEISYEQSLSEIKDRVLKNPNWYKWRFELFKLGIEREDMRSKVADFLEDGRSSIERQLTPLLQNENEARALASLLLACFDGLALQKIIDDSFSIDESYIVLSKVIDLYTNSRSK